MKIALVFIASLSFYSLSGQNVGVGTTTPQARLEVRNGPKADIKIRSNNFEDTSRLVLSNRNNAEQGTDFIFSSNREEGLRLSSSSDLGGNTHDSIMMISPGGRVGFNTITPTEVVDVRGNINVTGTIKVNGVDGNANQVLMKNSSGTLTWSDMSEYKNIATFLTGTSSWTVPANVTKILVEVWAAGGGANIFNSGSGGGYVRAIFTVTPGSSVNYTVGVGGNGSAGGSGTDGGISQVVVGSVSVTATAGRGATAASGTTMGFVQGGFYLATAGFTNHFGMRGESSRPNITTYIQSGTSTFLEVSSNGKGGDAANSTNTGGDGAYRVVDASTGTTIRYAGPTFGRQPGGGGGAGYSMLSIGGFGGGGGGGDGMVIIHF